MIEQEGIRRAWNEIKQADCVLHVLDVNNLPCSEDISTVFLDLPKNTPIIQVVNKIDLSAIIPHIDGLRVFLSALTGHGLDCLKKLIKQVVGYQATEGIFLARRRHIQALEITQQILLSGTQQLHQHHALELLADDLRHAHEKLSDITGEFTNNDLLEAIFSTFCIGK